MKIYAIKTNDYAKELYEKIKQTEGAELVSTLLTFLSDALKNHDKIPIVESKERIEKLKNHFPIYREFALQIPFLSVSAEELWEKVILKLSEVAREKGKTLLVSEFLSNYDEIRRGFKKGSYETVGGLSYPDGYEIFESAKKGFYKIKN